MDPRPDIFLRSSYQPDCKTAGTTVPETSEMQIRESVSSAILRSDLSPGWMIFHFFFSSDIFQIPPNYISQILYIHLCMAVFAHKEIAISKYRRCSQRFLFIPRYKRTIFIRLIQMLFDCSKQLIVSLICCKLRIILLDLFCTLKQEACLASLDHTKVVITISTGDGLKSDRL